MSQVKVELPIEITMKAIGTIEVPDPVIPSPTPPYVPDPSIKFGKLIDTTTYLFTKEDNGLFFICTNIATTGIELTIPKGLGSGWNVTIYRKDKAGPIKFISQGILEAEANILKRAKTAATIICYDGDLHIVLGALQA